MKNVPLVFVDTETTGLSYKRQTWEVAMIRDEPDGRTEEVSFFLPIHNFMAGTRHDQLILGDEVNEESLQIGKFYDRYPNASLADNHVKEKPTNLWTIPQAAAEIYRMTYGAHFVGMCPDFDAFNLWRILIAAGIPNFKWYYQLIDVDMVLLGKFGGNLPVDTDKWSEYYGVSISDEDRHTALGDARWTRNLYYAVQEDISNTLTFKKLRKEDRASIDTINSP